MAVDHEVLVKSHRGGVLDAAITAINIGGVVRTDSGRRPSLTDEVGKEEGAKIIGRRQHVRLKGRKGNIDGCVWNAIGIVVDDPHRQVPSNIKLSSCCQRSRGIGDVHGLVKMKARSRIKAQYGRSSSGAPIIDQPRPIHLTIGQHNIARAGRRNPIAVPAQRRMACQRHALRSRKD